MHSRAERAIGKGSQQGFASTGCTKCWMYSLPECRPSHSWERQRDGFCLSWLTVRTSLVFVGGTRMNRALLFGIAMFFAVVGIALVGGEKSVAVAGHGCHGCSGCDGGCDGGCSAACGGRRGLLGGRRNKCCGEPCCGAAPVCPPACCGDPCCGRQGLFARLRARKSCCGDPCCGPAPACCAPVCPPSCGGAAAVGPMDGPPAGAPAPAQVPAREAPKPAIN